MKYVFGYCNSQKGSGGVTFDPQPVLTIWDIWELSMTETVVAISHNGQRLVELNLLEVNKTEMPECSER